MESNQQQSQAINHKNGPLLVVAGAGTGKTTVLTDRIKQILKNGDALADNILALTFTEKAASEMITRLDEDMPYGYEEPWISTFHSFCDRILKSEGLEMGLNTSYKIITPAHQWILLKKNLHKLGLTYYSPLNNPTNFLHALLTFFSRLQDEDVQGNEIKDFLKKYQDKELLEIDDEQKYQEIFNSYTVYQQLKLEKNVLDFGDLNTWVLKLFRTRPNILKKYQKKFKHILIDEFQDTNFAQMQLIKLLAPPEKDPNLTVVGDDNQSIYAFRGSSINNILDFKKTYPNAKEVVLTTNYRSNQNILDASYNSIKNNDPDTLEYSLGISKQLISCKENNENTPRIVQADTLSGEADFVVEKITDCVQNRGYEYSDIAILARAHSHLDPFVAALKRSGIPYQLIGNKGLFDQDEVKDLLFFLRVVVNPEDGNSLFYFLHTPNFELSSQQILQWAAESKKEAVNLWDLVQKNATVDKQLLKIVNFITDARARDTQKSVTEIVYRFIQDSNYIKPYLDSDDIEDQLKIKNINIFFEKLKEFDSQFPHCSVLECIEYFDMLIEAGENPSQTEIEDVDTVNLLTIHASKGLEWPIVFVINLVADRFPSRSRKDAIELPDFFIKQSLPTGNAHLQEERRLFYVAMTRARDELYLTHGLDYGGIRKKKPSVFLTEINEDINPLKIISTRNDALVNMFKAYDTISTTKRSIPDKNLDLTHISYSQIDVYQTCPLKYKYQYVLNVPQQPHNALSFGTTIHNTLQRFHQHHINQLNPTLEELHTIYEEEFNQRPLGYQSPEHKAQQFQVGKEILSSYHQNHRDIFAGSPIVLEKSFRIPIEGVTLLGKIDRIDTLNKQTNDLSDFANLDFELIDYKTGKVKDQKMVDKDAQLTIYAMASLALFGKLPTSLSLYFINEGQRVTTHRTEKQIEKKRQEIVKVIGEIKENKFPPKPGHNCKTCAYNNICPFAEK